MLQLGYVPLHKHETCSWQKAFVFVGGSKVKEHPVHYLTALFRPPAVGPLVHQRVS